jgi:methylated-DNA-[protein]-cysteine S-methyltransferase
MKIKMDPNGTDLRTGAILAKVEETVKTVPMLRGCLNTPLKDQAGLAEGVNEMTKNGAGAEAQPIQLRLERWESPMCALLIVTDDDGVLRAIQFGDDKSRMDQLLRHHYGDDYTIEEGKAPAPLKRALEAYFKGRLDALDELKTATGGTPFQREVWKALRTIPAGTTMSYGELARKVGRKGASRAVGAANGANPIPIVVPCHRVIGADGSLTGFGGGLANKKWLLEHEARFASVASGAGTPRYLV